MLSERKTNEKEKKRLFSNLVTVMAAAVRVRDSGRKRNEGTKIGNLEVSQDQLRWLQKQLDLSAG